MENNNHFGMATGGIKTVLMVVLMIALVAFVIAQTILTGWRINEINTPYSQQITVEGEGSASVAPDTASLSFGVETSEETVAKAQEKNTETVNALLADIRDLNIDDEDIKTSSYDVYEDQIWDPDTREYVTKGWIVSQWLDVTIRDTSIAPKVVALASEHEITNVSSLNFYKDDATESKQEARDEAITSAKRQAESIAESLGVEIFAVVDYYEWSNDPMPYYADRAMGYGGTAEAAIAPELQPGTEEVNISVSITYELR
ncbi:MAG: SIMPL domain-containing protein [Patescibacteria group bacterium]